MASRLFQVSGLLGVAMGLLALPAGRASDSLLGLLFIFASFAFGGISSMGRESTVTLAVICAALGVADTLAATHYAANTGMRAPTASSLWRVWNLLTLPLLFTALTVVIGIIRRR